MGSLILRVISQKGTAAGYSLRCISPVTAAAGIFSSASRFSNCWGTSKFNTMSVNSADESPSTLPSRISPWLMLPPSFGGGGAKNMVYNFYSLAENKVVSLNKTSGGGEGREEPQELPDDDAKLVGSSHGWLALFNERNCDLFLSHPLSHQHIKFPPIHTLPIPQVNLRGGFGCVKKVIISDDDCRRVIMSYGPEERLAFCCPGHSTDWAPIGEFFHVDEEIGKNIARVYEDFIYSSTQRLLFCITQFSDLECWDLHDPQSPRIDWELELDLDEEYCDHEPRRQLKYLVFAEKSNQLFLMTRHIMERMGPDGSYVKSIYYGKYKGLDDSYPYKIVGFDVYKIDGEGGKLRMEASLDGLIMFIGINHSFAMSAAEFPKLSPNSIYFTDAKELTPPNWITSMGYGGHDIGIFDYTNRTFSSCYYPKDVQSIKRIVPAPMWFTPSQAV